MAKRAYRLGADRNCLIIDTDRRPLDIVKRALVRFVPAAILGWLGVVQSVDALRGAVHITVNPNWLIAVDVMREIVYGAFMFGAAIILLTSKVPRRRDRRARVFAAAMGASFLLVGVGLLPPGPLAWEPTVRTFQIGLLSAAAGASVAAAALVSLGSSFSIVPEARALVVNGPYRWIRHPMYLAEIVIMVGVVLSDPRVTYLVGTLGVCALQVYRIRTEEQLLTAAFPTSYKEFVTRTQFRLLPGVW
jgi:protein-S-isoprenylcysteine O-methyltransferase Ste14